MDLTKYNILVNLFLYTQISTYYSYFCARNFLLSTFCLWVILKYQNVRLSYIYI